MKVLLTRARAPAEATAKRLRERGHEPVLLPLVEYRDTGAALPQESFDAVAFTSAAAIATIADRPAETWAPLRALPAFCVGEATARAAREAGFGRVIAGPGDAAGLADRIASARDGRDPPRRLFYPAPRDRAFDLASALSAHGIAVTQTELYAAETVDPGEPALREALAACSGGAILLYSSRSATHLFALATKYALNGPFAGLTLIAISENVARAIAGHGLPDILVSEKPHEDGLFEILDRLA